MSKHEIELSINKHRKIWIITSLTSTKKLQLAPKTNVIVQYWNMDDKKICAYIYFESTVFHARFALWAGYYSTLPLLPLSLFYVSERWTRKKSINRLRQLRKHKTNERLTESTDFTTSQWSCELPLISLQLSSISAVFFFFLSGTWPFCFGPEWSNLDPEGPTHRCGSAQWPEDEEPFNSDVATTIARSVKIAADSIKVRSMSDPGIVKNHLVFHVQPTLQSLTVVPSRCGR